MRFFADLDSFGKRANHVSFEHAELVQSFDQSAPAWRNQKSAILYWKNGSHSVNYMGADT